jgi:hypothetical protein
VCIAASPAPSPCTVFSSPPPSCARRSTRPTHAAMKERRPCIGVLALLAGCLLVQLVHANFANESPPSPPPSPPGSPLASRNVALTNTDTFNYGAMHEVGGSGLRCRRMRAQIPLGRREASPRVPSSNIPNSVLRRCWGLRYPAEDNFFEVLPPVPPPRSPRGAAALEPSRDATTGLLGRLAYAPMPRTAVLRTGYWDDQRLLHLDGPPRPRLHRLQLDWAHPKWQ